jgi:protoporphyrinogen oxidase
MSERTTHTLVIGAGPAGIGAALSLGDAALVLERGPDAGGLCATVTLEGAVFDLGGHSFHTPHREVRELVFGALTMEEYRRDAWCYVKGEWIAYPFQRHFAQLRDAEVVEQCRAGLEERDASRDARNFDEHLERRHGAGIARHFLRPYNEKLWGRDLTRLDSAWAAERVPGAVGTAAPAQSDAARTPLQSDTRIAYPARGGFGEIYRALAARVPHLSFGETVAGIDPGARRAVTGKGDSIAWKHLVSTLPLPALLAMLPGVPESLRKGVAELVAVPLALVLVAIAGPLRTRRQRVYCADGEFPGHKVVINHNSSAFLRALPHHGILVEVSAANAAHADDDALVGEAVRGLRSMGLLEPTDDIAATRVIRLACGYPVPTHARAQVVEEATRWLAERHIHSVGRWGEWAYINSDEALHRGMRLGAALAGAG